ncbi:MAG: hypothetical protein KJ646_05345 [Nanoarchaeota archaeon]|nr:hypothetical protein [Nanoarchaeota archaeon]
MITYNDIYEAARKERYSEQLQTIPKNFISEVAVYLKEKKEIALKNDDFSDSLMKTKKQLENAITLFNELMLRRKRKIMNLVLIASETGIAKQDFENMFAFEKNLFENLIKCLESSQRNFNEILHGKQEETQKNELIVFKENVEEFVDFNGEKMGGFEKGQIANIPKEISKILIADEKAEVVEK